VPAAPSAATVPTAAAHKPAAQMPTAQQPSAQKAPPRPDPKVAAAEKVINAGDLVCGQCGEGNDPARKFCRKCGNSLAAAVVAKKLPWWKKLFGGKKAAAASKGPDGRTGKEKRKAAQRQASFKASQVRATATKAIFVLGALGIGASFIFIPNVGARATKFARENISKATSAVNPKFEAVNATSVNALTWVPGHEPNFANDLGINTYWAEGAEAEGIGQSQSFTFEGKVELAKVILTVGATETPEIYLNNPRPKQLHIVFDTGKSADITLKDEFQKAQSFSLKGAKGVSKVDIVIASVYQGKAGGGSDSGIAEVEFKKKG
jgi:hypothetical protein